MYVNSVDSPLAA